MNESTFEHHAPTAAEWRQAMGYFPTGVTIATSWDGAKPVGSTINAFCSVSLEPPMLLICLDLKNPLVEPVRQSRVLGVNILCEDSHSLALHFAKNPETDRFATCAYHAVGRGAPQLDLAPVFVDCTVEAIHEAGDHLIVVCRGIRTEHRQGVRPLLYHRGRFAKTPEV
jgi:3-hydroxy-9,10-secoandrosta-1,3,5(10)-triene-9,17-dione monooxygenase reductase component